MIFYRDGYKYQLAAEYSVPVPIKQDKGVVNEFITLTSIGILTIKDGYAWDGPSGPTIDTKNFMRGSLVHDALYQLMREGILDEDTWRETADNILHDICREDGMSWLRAWYVLRGVRMFGGPSANPANEKKVITAP
jgi:hypothetical protein